MNVLIIYAHPKENSFCSAIKEMIVKGLKINKNTVRIHDLYYSKFNPLLSKEELLGETKSLSGFKTIVKKQHDIKWANVIIIIHPAWWYGVPAILKGYFDRVLTEGFAFNYEVDHPVPLLTDKKGILIQTFDVEEQLEKEFFGDITYKSVYYVWKYCGVEDWQKFAKFRVNFVSKEQREEWLEEVYQMALKIK